MSDYSLKKIFSFIGIGMLLLVLLTSCGCKHEWRAATCTEPKTCSKCGKTQGNALGHKYDKEKTMKEPTCSEEGKEEYKCSVCGETKYEEIEKLPHQYKDGYCTVCFAEYPSSNLFNPTDGEKEKIDQIAKIGDRTIKARDNFYYLLFSFYDEDQNTVVAPCVLKVRIVNDKNEIVYRSKRVVETSDYSTWSNSYKEVVLASPKIMRSDIKEGLSSTGTVYFTIELLDGYYFKESSVEISNLPTHSFKKEEVLREATCGTDGYVRKTCSSCGQVIEEKIPATGRHTYRKGAVLKEPTCATEGIMEYACIVCGYVGSTEKIETIEHTFVNDRCTSCGTLRVGSEGPAGGFVFYDCDLDNENGNADGLVSSECGWRFLEAAPEDVSAIFGYYRHRSNGENLCVNGVTKYYKENCTRTDIGYGKRNTEMLVDAMGDETYDYKSGSDKTSNYAAKICADYSLNGYDDWFLPSKDELNLMFINLFANLDVEHRGNFSNGYYLSSSEYNNIYAWFQYFFDGSQNYYDRYIGSHVRPIRAFSL